MKIKVGIIGCGSIARFRHAPEYTINSFVNDIVFYDRNPERAAALADMFDGTVAKTVDELLSNPDIQVISDCSSNENHHFFSTRALYKGKHVLCEKPISLTIKDAEEIIKAQRYSGKKLMVGHNQRLTKAHQEAKAIIASNKLGKVLTFKTTFGHSGPEKWGINNTNSTWFFKKNRSYLGVGGDLGVHKIDLLQYLLNDKIDKVSAFQSTLDKVDERGDPIEVCDNIVSILKTKQGYLGTASFSWTYYAEEDNSTIIYCENGVLKIYSNPNYQLQITKDDGQQINYKLENIQVNNNQTNSGVIDAFINSIRFDTEPLITGQDALSSLRVTIGILEAAETKKVVTI